MNPVIVWGKSIMNKKRLRSLMLGVAVALVLPPIVLAQQTYFSNRGSIVNTRHNMTQRPEMGETAVLMDNYRNNYTEVCVYCHTPHAANASITAPLWNRNFTATTYTTYDQLNTTTLTQTVSQPGAASLMCLSCHDGKQAVDAILNMPGSGGYSAAPNEAFLDSWDNPGRFGGGHLSLGTPAWGPSGLGAGINFPTTTTCLTCHSPGVEGNTLSGSGHDFSVANIGTDLRNDHPVGVTYPATNGSGTDWNTPTGIRSTGGATTRFFEETSNGRLDNNEIRLYDSGNGPSVECASCHDPHGVPSAGAGSQFFPTFMRKSNAGSALCLTCHSK
jgi:hypothetical protein